MHSRKKTQLSHFAHALCATHIHIRCQYQTSQIFFKPSQLNKIVLKQVEENAKTNNDERNQAIRMLNAGMSAAIVSRHFNCTRKTFERLRRRFRVTGNLADRPRSGRPRSDHCYR